VSIKEILIGKLIEKDNDRPRTTQVAVGPSEIGGCRRKIWHRVNQTTPTNPDTLRLAAIMGTALHSMIEEVFASDPRYLTEKELEADGVMGHIDLIDTETHTVWDWKTTTKNSLAYLGSHQQRVQAQIYGYLANANGIQVDYVGLVAIARDGNETDIVEWKEPFDLDEALTAIENYKAIREQFDPPRPEKDATFCASYCEFYGACPGIQDINSENTIDNPELADLVNDYKDLTEQSKQIDGQLKFIKQALEGTQGITSNGVVVRWSQVAGRSSVDEAEVLEKLGYVPKKVGESYARLVVK